MKVFVAGGSGVLGRASLRALITDGHDVRATARGPMHAAAVSELGAQPVDVDLFDAVAVGRAIAGSDVVLRLTTKIPKLADMRSSKAWEATNRLRTEGARILVDVALTESVPIYINESVTFMYRDGADNWLDEEAPVDAESQILQAAIRGEEEAARFSNAGGRGIVLRFGGFYSADSSGTRDMIEMARHRKLPQIGPGTNYFSSIYVPDAGAAVAAALDVPAGIYNVVDDEPVRFAEYLRAIADAAGAPKPMHLPGFIGPLTFGEVWHYFSRSQRVSNAKFKGVSAWEPAVKSAREGWPLIARELSSRAHSHSMVPGGL